MKRNDKSYRYYLLILFVAILAMFPVALLIHPLKYDLIDQAYPWKYFIGECLQEGILPLWNPYQLLGSPIHADPQSSAWYPITWFIGYFFGYDIYTISIDFMLHIFLAGMGMFYLGKQLRFKDETAFFMAVSYMLSGFFIGNAQHFMWIISGTWIPFILGAFISLKEKPGTEAAVRFSLAFFMIVTGGYPAFIFLLAYLLTALFILFISGYLRNRDRAGLTLFLRYTALAVLFSVLVSAVMLISVYHVQDAITRSGGVTLKQALFCAFTPKSFISFILPFASIRHMEFFNTDLSMSNAYFGLIPLVFFMVALAIRKPAMISLFMAWGIFCLIASTGEATPLREFLYHYIPGMDQFRFPSLFRIFVILSFIIVAGYGFEKLKTENFRLRKELVVSIGIVSIVILGLIIFSFTRKDMNFWQFIKDDLFIFSEKSRISQHIIFQGIIQIILLGLFIVLLRWKKKKHLVAGILFLVSIDLVIATHLNGPYTLYSHLFRSKEVHVHAQQFPKGFPLPGNGLIIDNKDQGGLTFQTLWRNLNIFHRQVSYQGYNPLHLNGFENLADNHTRLFETILHNPLVYQSAKVSSLESLAIHEKNEDYDRGRVYLSPEDYVEFQTLAHTSADRDTVLIRSFTPVEIKVESTSRGPVFVNLLQNNYHGWKASVDGNPSNIYTSNMSFISVYVPAGVHEINFLYDPKDVKYGFYITLIALVAGLVILGRTLQGL